MASPRLNLVFWRLVPLPWANYVPGCSVCPITPSFPTFDLHVHATTCWLLLLQPIDHNHPSDLLIVNSAEFSNMLYSAPIKPTHAARRLLSRATSSSSSSSITPPKSTHRPRRVPDVVHLSNTPEHMLDRCKTYEWNQRWALYGSSPDAKKRKRSRRDNAERRGMRWDDRGPVDAEPEWAVEYGGTARDIQMLVSPFSDL